MNVTAILMGDPAAAIYRRPPTEAERKHRQAFTPDIWLNRSRPTWPARQRVDAMQVGDKMTGLTKAQAIHRCMWLLEMGRKGRRRAQLDGTVTVERIR
jgi:hypothetical protein